MKVFPRKNRVYLMIRAEVEIQLAIDEVEKLPADVRLTDAIIKLNEAKDLVSDFVDNPPPPHPKVI